MPALCLFEDDGVRHLAPLTLTRHTADLRLGMHTLGEMHRAAFRPEPLAFHGRPEVAAVTRQEHPGAAVNEAPAGAALYVNARYVPEPGALLDRLRAAARPGEPARAFRQRGAVVAAWLPEPAGSDPLAALDGLPEEAVDGARMLDRLWHLLDDVGARIAADFEALGRRGVEGTVHDGARVVGEAVWIAPGAEVRPGAVVSALDGPVVLAEGALVEENAVIQGPCAIGEKAVVKATARVDGSAIGYWSKVGGEVHGSVLHSLSSKAHDGYLGNSYLGRWCNLGADTNTSNLKNDYGEVSMYDPVAGDFVGTERQFLGLVMGDHAKCSINTMFNTGTVVGVFANLFGAGFPPRFVPSFTWGGADGLVEYRLDKALRVAEAVMARRKTPLTDADRALLAAVFEGSRAAREAAA